MTERGGNNGADGVRSGETVAAVSLGSNIEPRRDHLARALAMLAALPGTRLLAASSVAETEPEDVPEEFASMKFLNQAALFATTLDAMEFSHLMHGVEDALGRVRTVRNGPRTVDVDLVDFGGIRMDSPGLVLPHPRAAARPFVVGPLREIGFDVSALAAP